MFVGQNIPSRYRRRTVKKSCFSEGRASPYCKEARDGLSRNNNTNRRVNEGVLSYELVRGLICPECGIETYLNESYATAKEGKLVYCPNGHAAILRMSRRKDGTVK